MLVTIRGMLGSGAREVGKEVARLIKGDYVDRRILEEIAGLVGQPVEQVAAKENVSSGLAQRIVEELANAFKRTGSTESAYSRKWQGPLNDSNYLYALKSVIQGLSLEQSIVIHGRGSQFILKHHPSAVHVLVVAPLSERVKRVMESEQIDLKSARKLIHEHDRSLRLFIDRFFRKDIEDFAHYDLIVNTKRLDVTSAAQIIACAVKEKSHSSVLL